MKRQSDNLDIYIPHMQLAGEWAALCSQRPGTKCTSTDVFRSKYGNGYDEEESLHDYTSGDYSCMFDVYFSFH